MKKGIATKAQFKLGESRSFGKKRRKEKTDKRKEKQKCRDSKRAGERKR